MGAGRIDLFDEYRETGFDGKYEKSTYYRLIVGEGDGEATAALEVEVTTRVGFGPTEQESLIRYEIGVRALVALLKKEGKQVG